MAGGVPIERVASPDHLADRVHEVGHETRLMALDALIDLLPRGNAGKAAAALEATWLAGRIAETADVVSAKLLPRLND